MKSGPFAKLDRSYKKSLRAVQAANWRRAKQGFYAVESLERRRLLSLTVPAYSSLPGAAKSIFLDFDGNAAFSWNNGQFYAVHGPGSSVDAVPGFNLDSDPLNFSSTELTEINQIWQWVSEKYSPFNVNVTTVDPGNRTHNVVEQCLIGGSVNDWYKQAGFSGVSAIGGFTDPSQSNTCFVFANDGAGTSQSFQVKTVGDEVAHEVGHSMGLVHERTPGNEYYPGDSTRVPIMGGSNANFTGKGIWWKTNNWPGQNSTDPGQDELYIMATIGPLPYRKDDYDFPGTLTLTGGGSFAAAYGVIEKSDDADSFNFTPPSNAANFTVKNATLGGMLTPQVSLYDPTAGVILTNVVVTNTSTQATISTNALTAGRTYRLIVRGSGQYGDIGQYSVNGTAAQLATLDASTHRLSISGRLGSNNVVVSVVYNGAGDPGLLQVSDSLNGASPSTQTFPINSVQNIDIELSGSNNTISIQPLYPLYTSGEIGGPNVTVIGSGSDSLTLDMASATGSFTVDNPGIFRHVLFVSTNVYLARGISNLTLQAGYGTTAYNINNWDNTIQLRLNGAFGYNNQFNFNSDDFNAINPDIIVTGSSGTDTINVDASALGGPLNGSVTNSNFSLGNSGTVLQGIIFDYSSIESINITATASADSINVYSLASTTTVFFHGGSGNDTVRLGYAAGSINLDQILGSVYFYGDGGTDTGILDDAYNAFGRTYVVDHGHIGTTAGANLITAGSVESLTVNGGSATSTYSIFEGQPGVTLTLNGGAGADTINFSGTTWNAYVYGNGGFNTLNVDDRGGVSAPFRTDIRDQSVTHFYGTPSSPTSYAIAYNNIGSASYYGTPTTNQLNVFSTSSDIATGYQWTAVMNTGNDTINVYPHNSATGAATLLGGIGILGGGGTDTINFDDSATPVAVNYRFYNPYGSSTANIAGLGGALVGVANDIENIVVLGTPLADLFQIDTFQTGNALTLNGNAGNDTFELTPTSKDISANINASSAFNFIGGAGTDALNIHNDASSVSWYYGQSATSILLSKNGYGFSLANSAVDTFSLAAGSAADTFSIQNPSNTTTTIAAGGGLNSVNVSSGGNAVFATSQTLSALSLDNSVLAVASNGNLVVRTNSLSLSSGAKLDLTNNTLIDDYTGSTPAATVLNNLKSGRAGGTWNGSSGITSSAVAGVPNSSLGYAEASAILGPTGGTFAGQTVDGTALLVRFTLLGDANLDRKVDVVDLGNLSSNWQHSSSGWAQGDFNYDNIVDVVDLGSLSSNWQKTFTPPPSGALPPAKPVVVAPPKRQMPARV